MAACGAVVSMLGVQTAGDGVRDLRGGRALKKFSSASTAAICEVAMLMLRGCRDLVAADTVLREWHRTAATIE